MQVEILRPLKANGKMLERGDIVDASGWRTLHQLVRQRWVRLVEEAALDERTARAVSDARQRFPGANKQEIDSRRRRGK